MPSPQNPPSASPVFFRLALRPLAIVFALALTACGGAVTPPPLPALQAGPELAAPAPEPVAPELAAPAKPARASQASYVARGKRYHILATAEGFAEQGLGAFYSNALHGRRTSSGEKYDKTKLTAAHKTLPLGTLVEVKNLENNKTVVVRINDRGPFSDEYVIDVSQAAARKLGMRQSVRVSLKAVAK